MLRAIHHRIIAALCVFCVAAGGVSAGERTVTVFTGRANDVEKEAMQRFEADAGVKVVVVAGKPEELIDRIAGNAAAPGADLFMAVDGGILNEAKRKGVFQATDSPALREAVPANLRDVDGAWVGVTTRARVIAYSLERVKPEELSSYMDLADPRWKGRVLTRSSGALYNRSLLCALVAAYGAERAREWSAGLVANLAREPKGNDRDQAKAVAAGVGDVAVMNSYYLGRMMNSEDAEEAAAARALGVFFPDQDGAGTHINVCGVGLVRNAANADDAMRLVEYLLSVPVQEALSAGNFEFPVNPKAKKAELLAGWGDFKAQTIDFAKMDEYKDCAKAIFAETDWK